MAEVQYGESSGTFFRHPISDEGIAITEAATPIEKLRFLCNPELLPDFSRSMFLALFPQDMELRPEFNIDSTSRMNKQCFRRARKRSVESYY